MIALRSSSIAAAVTETPLPPPENVDRLRGSLTPVPVMFDTATVSVLKSLYAQDAPAEPKPISETWAKTRIASIYDGAAPTYERVGPSFFSYFAERLLAATDVQPGSRVLDVATGSGAVLLRATRLAGPNGFVAGIDHSPRNG